MFFSPSFLLDVLVKHFLLFYCIRFLANSELLYFVTDLAYSGKKTLLFKIKILVIFFFLETREGMEKERERNIDV